MIAFTRFIAYLVFLGLFLMVLAYAAAVVVVVYLVAFTIIALVRFVLAYYRQPVSS